MTACFFAGLFGGISVGWLCAALLAQRSWQDAMQAKMCAHCGSHIAHFCSACTTEAIYRASRGEAVCCMDREKLSV